MVGGRLMAMWSMLGVDFAILRRPPLPRHPLRLGDLSGRHDGGDRFRRVVATSIVYSRSQWRNRLNVVDCGSGTAEAASPSQSGSRTVNEIGSIVVPTRWKSGGTGFRSHSTSSLWSLPSHGRWASTRRRATKLRATTSGPSQGRDDRAVLVVRRDGERVARLIGDRR